MSTRIVVAAFVILGTFWGAPAFASPILVRLEKNQSQILVTGFGLRLLDVINAEILPKRASWLVTRQGNSWRVNGKKIDTKDLQIVGEDLKLNQAAAGDKLRIVARQGVLFDVVAELDLEFYLKGVLPSEMPAKWPIEALKAQAVASRTYAMNIRLDRMSEHFHVDDTVQHQVYSFEKYLAVNPEERAKVERALVETKGEYLQDNRGAAYRTYFHSDCGGVTEDPKNVWGVGPSLGRVSDERCAINPLSEWSTVIAGDELAQKLQAEFGLAGEVRLAAVQVASRTDSGRVHEMMFHFSEKSTRAGVAARTVGEFLTGSLAVAAEMSFRALNSQEFRRLFGFNRVKSTQFSIEPDGTRGFALRGRGHGHGVGMCQKGARFMALAGSSYREILQRYYPKAHPARLAGPQ